MKAYIVFGKEGNTAFSSECSVECCIHHMKTKNNCCEDDSWLDETLSLLQKWASHVLTDTLKMCQSVLKWRISSVVHTQAHDKSNYLTNYVSHKCVVCYRGGFKFIVHRLVRPGPHSNKVQRTLNKPSALISPVNCINITCKLHKQRKCTMHSVAKWIERIIEIRFINLNRWHVHSVSYRVVRIDSSISMCCCYVSIGLKNVHRHRATDSTFTCALLYFTLFNFTKHIKMDCYTSMENRLWN